MYDWHVEREFAALFLSPSDHTCEIATYWTTSWKFSNLIAEPEPWSKSIRGIWSFLKICSICVWSTTTSGHVKPSHSVLECCVTYSSGLIWWDNIQVKQHTSETTYKSNNIQVKQHTSETTYKWDNIQMRQHHHVKTTVYCLTNAKIDISPYIQGCVQFALNEVCAFQDSVAFFFKFAWWCENVKKPLIYKSQVSWFIKTSIIRQCLKMYTAIRFMKIKWYDIYAKQRPHSYD